MFGTVLPCSARGTYSTWITYIRIRDGIGPSGGWAEGRTTTDGISKVCKNCERLSPTVLVNHQFILKVSLGVGRHTRSARMPVARRVRTRCPETGLFRNRAQRPC